MSGQVPREVYELLADHVTPRGIAQWFAAHDELYAIDRMSVLVKAEELADRLERGQGET